MTEAVTGPGLVCPACGSPHVDLRRGLLCEACAETVAEEAAAVAEAAVMAPGVCLCSHLRGSHEARSFNGERFGPCIIRICGCGRYRPDPRGITGRQQEARRSA